MSQTLATSLVLLAVSMASPAWVKEMPGNPKAQAAPRTSVAMVLVRAGVAGETVALRDLLNEPVAALDPAQVDAGDRAAIRVCHTERYLTARHKVLTGRAQPLGTC